MNLSIIAAFVADLIVGDSENYPHPVRIIGRAIGWLENLLKDAFANKVLAGGVLFFVTVISAYLVSLFIYSLAARLHPFLGFVANVILIYWSLSVKSLGDEAMRVYEELVKGDVVNAKERLARIVGRDTAAIEMEENDIARAGVESVSENLVDGVISPLFFAAIGGGPFAIAYKAVNTCDSMLGYRNEEYEKFGKVSALVDDAANFIPARLSVALIAAASFVLGADYKSSWRVALKDRLNHPSPNAAHSEAAFAGALGVKLGGTAWYGGVKSEKPVIGGEFGAPDKKHLMQSVKLMRVTSLIACILFAYAASV